MTRIAGEEATVVDDGIAGPGAKAEAIEGDGSKAHAINNAPVRTFPRAKKARLLPAGP